MATRLGQRGINECRVEGEAAILSLTDRRGRAVAETRVSLCDLARVLAEGKWFHSRAAKRVRGVREFYPVAQVAHLVGGRRRILRLHRFVVSAPARADVDHINHDTLDNRRENLRLVTKSQNAQNLSGAHRDSKSGVRNVYWDAEAGKWAVQVSVNRKRTCFGRFATIAEAAAVATRERQRLQTHCPENTNADH